MSIVNLKSIKELEEIIGTDLVKLGTGCEGITYLSKKDNKAYKILTDFEYEDKIEDIITSFDINLKYILLPEKLYVYDNILIAYKTKYIKKNFLDIDNKDNNIYNIDFDKFITAYKNLLEEIKILSKNKIEIYDVTPNLMFDGTDLYLIDTCSYKKTNEKIYKIYNWNKERLDSAIKFLLSSYIINDENKDKYGYILTIRDLEEQLNEIKNSIKR